MLQVKLRAIPPRGGIPRLNHNYRVARTPTEKCYRAISPDPDRERDREALIELLREKATYLAELVAEAQSSGLVVTDEWLAWAKQFIERWR